MLFSAPVTKNNSEPNFHEFFKMGLHGDYTGLTRVVKMKRSKGSKKKAAEEWNFKLKKEPFRGKGQVRLLEIF